MPLTVKVFLKGRTYINKAKDKINYYYNLPVKAVLVGVFLNIVVYAEFEGEKPLVVCS